MNADQLYHGPELCEFSRTAPTELSSLIRSMAKKSCSFDPITGSLTRINDDLLRASDDNACVIVVLLDLSAAFDTVEHQILLTRIKCRYGVKGNALAWMRSYLSNRLQYVRVANDCSSKHKLAMHRARALRNKINNDREDAINATALLGFNDLGHLVTPTFLSRNRFYVQ